MMKGMLLGLTSLTFVATAAAIEAPHVPGEVIVKFKKGHEKSFFSDKSVGTLEISGNREVKLSYGKLNVLKISDKSSMTKILADLNNNPNIEYAEPNFIYTIDPVMNSRAAFKKVMESPFAELNVSLPNDARF